MKKKFRKTIAVLLMITMVFSAVPLTGFDGLIEDFDFSIGAKAAENTEYGPLTYSISDGTAIITLCDNSYTGVIEIPDEIDGYPVVKIKEKAFQHCDNITEIFVPGSVKTVGDSAFYHCDNLKVVHFSEGVETIGTSAFSACRSWESLHIPSTLKNIEKGNFYSGFNLDSITVSSDSEYFCTDKYGVLYTKDYSELLRCPAHCDFSDYIVDSRTKIIGEDAFSYVNGIKKITAESGLEIIEKRAFFECCDIIELNIPDTVTEIGKSVFYGTDITNVIIPPKVTVIEDGTYSYCKKLKQVIIPDWVTACKDSFVYANMDEFCIGKKLEQMGNLLYIETGRFTADDNNPYFSSDEYGVLYNKDKTILLRFPVLSDITEYGIPEGVTTIAENAFSGTKKLEIVGIPKSVVKIANYAFDYSKVNYIGYEGTQEEWNHIEIEQNAFRGTDNVYDYYDMKKETGSCGEGITWTYEPFYCKLIIEGNGAMDSYDSSNEYSWYRFKNKIEYIEISDGITNVSANAFKGYPMLGEVYLGKTVSEIGENAFGDCSTLSIVTIRSDVLDLNKAFSKNNSRLTFVVDDGNISIADYASEKNIPVITVGMVEKDDEKVLQFSGKTIVYNGLQYYYLNKFITEYGFSDFLCFDKLVFDGVKSENFDILDINIFEEIDTQSEDFTLNNLYVSLKVVCGDNEREITFAELLELLESGNYDAFKLRIKSDEVVEESTFFEKVRDFFVGFVEDALRLMSKAVNFIVSIFKKK